MSIEQRYVGCNYGIHTYSAPSLPWKSFWIAETMEVASQSSARKQDQKPPTQLDESIVKSHHTVYAIKDLASS